MSEVWEKGRLAKQAAAVLVTKTTAEKNEALGIIAEELLKQSAFILAENEKDLAAGREAGFTASLLDRLLLTESRLRDIADAIGQLQELTDPVGETVQTIERPNGLSIQQVRVPIGVVGMIYEARPNVTVDAATLCLKTGNAVILRGSSSAKHSNMAIVQVMHDALRRTSLPVDSVQLLEDTSRETAKELFTLNEYLDVLIPRGGKNLIDTVVREASVPVLETGAGNCHVFIDETADTDMAKRIVLNAKVQRPSVCNSIETVLIHRNWLAEHGAALFAALREAGVEVHGDEAVHGVCAEAIPATEEDWETEYSALILAAKAVRSTGEAIEHINKYGTKHSEAILSQDEENVRQFLQSVDAAAVYHNASTRFTDGFEFGFGAEIGISTQKLHARGPMGLPALTSTKYMVRGNGQIRG
ncbi:glutamate-5-semialdehyde dehydrogenase [Ectobacillus ponti]|uniref:Gamma-glutamyl phosphate reductase n=1 Tax=Ectobacillus ponti TaxID=2961894 RepID=A0AA42BRL1_9BACI|nr:glutamate-5-semialdehyde dehydrogenase [Ectobacillus ponti]MCP8969609.1 glutamate-5-semialdehyde dehydrogenase [Ectobacillus ponti]